MPTQNCLRQALPYFVKRKYSTALLDNYFSNYSFLNYFSNYFSNYPFSNYSVSNYSVSNYSFSNYYFPNYYSNYSFSNYYFSNKLYRQHTTNVSSVDRDCKQNTIYIYMLTFIPFFLHLSMA